MTVRVITTPPADEQILTVIDWWRRNRPAAPHLFEDELLAAFDLLAEQPEIGERDDRLGIPELRRLRLPRSRYHVFYLYAAELSEVRIRAVWSAVRGRGPEIDL